MKSLTQKTITPAEAKEMVQHATSEGGFIDHCYSQAQDWIHEQIRFAAMKGQRQVFIEAYKQPFSKEKVLSDFNISGDLALVRVANILRGEGWNVSYPNMSLTSCIIINL